MTRFRYRFRFQLLILLRKGLIQVSNTCSPSYCFGSDSGGSLHYIILRNFEIKLSFSQISIETVWKQVDFNLEVFILFSDSNCFKTNVSNPYLKPFYTRSRNLSRNRNIEQDHGSGSGSDRGKMIRFRRFQFGLRLRKTGRITKNEDRDKFCSVLSGLTSIPAQPPGPGLAHLVITC